MHSTILGLSQLLPRALTMEEGDSTYPMMMSVLEVNVKMEKPRP